MQNPFDTTLHRLHSCYCYPDGEQLNKPEGLAVADYNVFGIHYELRNKIVQDDGYPCVVARSAFNKQAYCFGVYQQLGSGTAAAGLARDLYTFIQDRDRLDARFATYLAIFLEPREMSEEQFEQLLWQQLLLLHAQDRPLHDWDPEASHIAEDERFSFSFAETAFFVVGMHANSSRTARRFRFPTLVFNLHAQFDELREDETFDRMKEVIRKRDIKLQGSINPMLSDYGFHSEASQYSGRTVDDSWSCPVHFTPRNKVDEVD